MLYANWKESFALGDRGPAGGYIFYINSNAANDGWTYLEAASADLDEEYTWGSDGSYSTKTAIGTGKSNTKALIGSKETNSELSFPAAEACVAYRGGWYEDWFLPSIDELSAMYTNLKSKNKGGTWQPNTCYYWSSSESSEGLAKVIIMSNGNSTPYSFSSECYVRPCRAF